ncbi:MAG: hypothetical protein CFH06_00925 [Alphaproteobacteria bacterium MarineAlpha3_Bin5]|nr:hypothetical protein [Magnetovibrio sp.]PPR78156.1 MAG: hypothetical protein CFH06_00925 [Alphaproteobacteria bacterium MarineAlpha3_Bin5]
MINSNIHVRPTLAVLSLSLAAFFLVVLQPTQLLRKRILLPRKQDFLLTIGPIPVCIPPVCVALPTTFLMIFVVGKLYFENQSRLIV